MRLRMYGYPSLWKSRSSRTCSGSLDLRSDWLIAFCQFVAETISPIRHGTTIALTRMVALESVSRARVRVVCWPLMICAFATRGLLSVLFGDFLCGVADDSDTIIEIPKVLQFLLERVLHSAIYASGLAEVPTATPSM
jgi:hypothetical protein